MISRRAARLCEQMMSLRHYPRLFCRYIALLMANRQDILRPSGGRAQPPSVTAVMNLWVTFEGFFLTHHCLGKESN